MCAVMFEAVIIIIINNNTQICQVPSFITRYSSFTHSTGNKNRLLDSCIHWLREKKKKKRESDSVVAQCDCWKLQLLLH